METHQLEGKLKSLRLSGMLATLEARLAQARAGELGHLELLEVLLEDEISRREAKALAERLRRARFECEATLEEFDFAYNPGLPAPLIRDLAALRFLERGESVLLYGPVGVGKTHVAQALGHTACRRGYSVLFAKTSRVLAELAGGRADGSWEARLRRLARVDLLILDDFALRAFTGAQGDDFYELVSERAGRGSLILTANRSPKDWYELFPNAVVAEGVLDRLVNSSFHVHMEGNSYRPKRRPGQGVKLEKGGAKG
jgi:DNA replication protein DnaC